VVRVLAVPQNLLSKTCKIAGSKGYDDVVQNVRSCDLGRFLMCTSIQDGSSLPQVLRTGRCLRSWTQTRATSSRRVGPTSSRGGGFAIETMWIELGFNTDI
jgi:hypothetical protein